MIEIISHEKKQNFVGKGYIKLGSLFCASGIHDLVEICSTVYWWICITQQLYISVSQVL